MVGFVAVNGAELFLQHVLSCDVVEQLAANEDSCQEGPDGITVNMDRREGVLYELRDVSQLRDGSVRQYSTV